MYIDFQFIQLLLSISLIVFVGFLIYTLVNINKIIKNVNDMLIYNAKSINDSLDNVPKIIRNVEEITDNAKDVSDVATDIAADIVVTKESIKSNTDIAMDVVTIVKNIFMK
ncbi:MAG: hypothetical protein R3Y64_00730 [Peptostreptococcaceae bacterium]